MASRIEDAELRKTYLRAIIEMNVLTGNKQN